MDIKELDTVVLECDLAEHGLARGDVGAVVQLYPSDAMAVEFVTASGQTQALVTLKLAQVRPLGPRDMPAMRQVSIA